MYNYTITISTPFNLKTPRPTWPTQYTCFAYWQYSISLYLYLSMLLCGHREYIFFPLFVSAHSLWCCFSSEEKKYGHFGGNGPWKNLYFQVVYTRTHNKRDCSDFERDSDIHIPNSSLSLPFKHVTFAPDSRNSLCGVFLLAFCFVLYNRLHEFVFIASRRYESLFLPSRVVAVITIHTYT